MGGRLASTKQRRILVEVCGVLVVVSRESATVLIARQRGAARTAGRGELLLLDLLDHGQSQGRRRRARYHELALAAPDRGRPGGGGFANRRCKAGRCQHRSLLRLAGYAVLTPVRGGVTAMPLGHRGTWEKDLCVRDVQGALGLHLRGRCRAGHQVPFDALDVQSVREHNAEQQHGHGQHAQRRTRKRTGPRQARR